MRIAFFDSSIAMQKHSNHLNTYMLAVLVGAIAGLLAAAFHRVLDFLAGLTLSLPAQLPYFSLPGSALSIPTWLPMICASGLSVCVALWLVRRFAPEAHGSGIPQAEVVLSGSTTIRWWRVIPVKFFGSIAAIAPGLLLGREGPTIHMGAACGEMVAGLRQREKHHRKPLIAAGVAAGLGAAFSAPLAGIMLVTEEMRDEFDYNHVSLMCVMLASCTAVMVSYGWLGQGLDLNLGLVGAAPIMELPLYALLGILAGALAVVYNRCLLFAVARFASLGKLHSYLAAAAVGVLIGALLWLAPDLVGAGEHLIERLVTSESTLMLLTGVLILRTVLSVLCYGTGVPGGIFAPLLALGALLGLLFSTGLAHVLPGLSSTPVMFTVAAMGALFAGTVRAPLTAIVLIIELTGAFEASLSIIITCTMASMAAEALSGKPIYSQLRQRGSSGQN
jgi:H+/Cl- antiporter ClcA